MMMNMIMAMEMMAMVMMAMEMMITIGLTTWMRLTGKTLTGMLFHQESRRISPNTTETLTGIPLTCKMLKITFKKT